MPDPFPDADNLYWSGYKDGTYCWTLQTYLILKSFGYDCELTSQLPARGIIVAHRGLLEDRIRPERGQYIVCIQADWSRHRFAFHHISQNRAQTISAGVPWSQRYLWPGSTSFVHLWAQPGILPRDPSRSTELKTIRYFGISGNLVCDSEAMSIYLSTIRPIRRPTGFGECALG